MLRNTFTPSNIYGPDNREDLDRGHLISSMIKKFDAAKDGDILEFWGTGNPLRQHLYVDDLAKIIPQLLEKHTDDCPIIVAPDENLSIKEIIETYKRVSDKKVEIKFNNKLDGQFRKDGSNKKLLNLVNNFEFTSLQEGLLLTHNWYYKNKKNLLL